MRTRHNLLTALLMALLAVPALAQQPPNILVIFGDDIGYWNVSYNTGGMMGYTTPNMETVDEEFLAAALDFIDRQHKAGKPFFTWFNSSRMHYVTHVPLQWDGKSGLNFYADGMLQHDSHVGQLLKKLDDLGIANNTIVIYSTDNGPHFNMWPDGGITPFRGEKNTNWEGAYRVPFLIRWPGKITAGDVSNAIASHTDWIPTLIAAAGDPAINR
jgi:arylsulfatase